MKKWKNLIAGLIVLALLMTGCSSAGQTAGNGPEAGSEAAAETSRGQVSSRREMDRKREARLRLETSRE